MRWLFMPFQMIREKPHRLGPEAYVGEVLVAFTACVEERRSLFVQDTVVLPFIEMLTETLERFVCSAPVYCFMPDHLHVIVQGRSASSDTRAVMSAFKQKSGFWLARHNTKQSWQKDFWDHVIRRHEDLAAQVRYIIENPVRHGLVRCWQDYPYTGSVGHDLDEILWDAVLASPE